MAKVMISIPDKLLEQVDRQAKAAGESRSGFLQRLAEQELDRGEEERRAEVRRLLDLATAPMGGEGAKMIREDRESH